ncbi:hypothetical protein BJ741DRAFT_576080 [Chytriomyces cf. hyalinus JEL632]|nr:hypothetical protein BJ741DRAFT_576080 [Chytriomyces cf. hyalinus JEL632]
MKRSPSAIEKEEIGKTPLLYRHSATKSSAVSFILALIQTLLHFGFVSFKRVIFKFFNQSLLSRIIDVIQSREPAVCNNVGICVHFLALVLVVVVAAVVVVSVEVVVLSVEVEVVVLSVEVEVVVVKVQGEVVVVSVEVEVEVVKEEVEVVVVVVVREVVLDVEVVVVAVVEVEVVVVGNWQKSPM